VTSIRVSKIAALMVFQCAVACADTIRVWTLTEISDSAGEVLCGSATGNMFNTLGSVQAIACGYTNSSGTLLDGVAKALGVPGDAKSYTEVDASNVVPQVQGIVIYAGTDIFDDWQILTPMYVTMTIDLYGHVSQSGVDSGYSAGVVGGYGRLGGGSCSPTPPGSPTPSPCTFTTPLLTPGIYTFDLGMSTRITYNPQTTTSSFLGIEDYYSSSSLVGISAKDASGDPVSLNNIISSTGLALTPIGYATIVPEPETLSVSGITLLALVYWRRRASGPR
jgi:hypothetical protein